MSGIVLRWGCVAVAREVFADYLRLSVRSRAGLSLRNHSSLFALEMTSCGFAR